VIDSWQADVKRLLSSRHVIPSQSDDGMTVLEDIAGSSQLHWSDYIVLIAYFVIVIGVGIWVSILHA